MPDVWTKVVPEGPDAIQGFNIVGDKIYVNRLHDVKTETAIYTLEGKPAGSVEYDGIGLATKSRAAARADTDFPISSQSSRRRQSTGWIR